MGAIGIGGPVSTAAPEKLVSKAAFADSWLPRLAARRDPDGISTEPWDVIMRDRDGPGDPDRDDDDTEKTAEQEDELAPTGTLSAPRLRIGINHAKPARQIATVREGYRVVCRSAT